MRERKTLSEKPSRKESITELVLQGQPPSQIAESLELSRAQVMQYLSLLVGEGTISRSDILQSISRPTREIVDELYEKLGNPSAHEILDAVSKSPEPTTTQDLITYLELRDAVLVDMYERIRRIELLLHGHVKRTLLKEFGEEGWWREGIPASIRANCAALRETDPDPAPESFSYTMFINLKEIFEFQWELLSGILSKEMQGNRKEFRSALDRLNIIRNCVMHPVRMAHMQDDDFAFVDGFSRSLNVDRNFEVPAAVIDTEEEALPLP